MTEKEMVYTALKGWVRYIETGQFSGIDKGRLIELAKDDKDMEKVVQRLPCLTEEQRYFIKQINSLADKVLNTGNIQEEVRWGLQ